MAQPQTLGQMLQIIDAQMQHSPQHRTDRSFKTSLLNQALSHYSEEALWPFLCLTIDVGIRAKVTGSSSATIAIDTATNPRLVTGTGTTFTQTMQGQTFVMPDGFESTIVRVIGATSLYLSDSYTTTTAAETGWSVEFRQYRLDANATEILGAQFTDGAKETITLLSRRDVEDMELDVTAEGTVVAMLESNTFNDRAPHSAPVLTEGATSSGDFTLGHRLSYCVTNQVAGRESTPSAVTSITLANTSSSVSLSGLEDLRFDLPSSPKDSGLRKAVYRRNDTQNGPWMRVGIVAAGTTTFNDTTVLPSFNDELRDVAVLAHNGTLARHIRVYQLPSSDRTLRIRYKASPPPLVKDSDTPQYWPPEYHGAFWMHALGGVLRSVGDRATANDWKEEAETVIRRAKTRLISETARPTVAGNWSRRGGMPMQRYVNFGKS